MGYDVPLLVNLQPAGEYLGEDYHRAGGVPAVVAELIRGPANSRGCTHRQWQDHRRELQGQVLLGPRRHQGIWQAADEAMPASRCSTGNLFDSAIMKTSVISEEFRQRYLSNPKDPNAFEAKAIVFDGPEDYHANIDNPKLGIDENTILFMRGTGPLGYPGAAEVVNMRAPTTFWKRASARSPAWATAASPAPRARPRSSMPRRKPPPAAALPS